MATLRARRTWLTMGLGLPAATFATPPYSEDVKWMVLAVAGDHVRRPGGRVRGHRRPEQPTGAAADGREVLRDES